MVSAKQKFQSKTLLLLVLPLFVTQARANELSWRCFLSKEAVRPIYLAFSFGDNKGAVVRYKNGRESIVLKKIPSEAIEMVEGRPFEYTYEYLEDFRGSSGGKYTVIIQGANFYGFEYKPKDNSKVYRFDMDFASQSGNKCKWQEVAE